MIVALAMLVMLISKDVTSLSCLSNEVKKDFDHSRLALKEMEDHLRNTTKKLEESFKNITDSLQDQLGVVKDGLRNVGEKIKKVDSDFQLLGKDLQSYRTSRNYLRCRTVQFKVKKIRQETVNNWLPSLGPNKNVQYWIGLTDLIEGEFRWSFDQSKASFLTWADGHGHRGSTYNCVGMNSGGKAEWFDTSCNNMRYYICESNFCEFIVIQLNLYICFKT
ncbi:unnamed protein product [Mytilus edulis]|uniref:C-type lectin domain-containing protein n=1 Tax=Mytilus edulis TaxID=6550 RepID=A0A8S3PPI8_MYTED|nr:unnamed protein product [Mytilus edulis]